MATLSGLASRLVKLEAVLKPETLIIWLARPGGGELQGILSPRETIPYMKRKEGESEEQLTERACAEAEEIGGLVVLQEDRTGRKASR